jgi:8-oxo-dGTP pyrophosphatase MutT (NUDIX family)
MTLADRSVSIHEVSRVDIRFAPHRWAFAAQRRADIDAYFAARQAANPALWNGRVLLLHEYAIEDAAFRGKCFETDFASLLAWFAWDSPDPRVRNSFGMGALRAADGAFLLGVMSQHTTNAGRIYFPAGVLEPGDLVDGEVDLLGSIRREIEEETGLTGEAYEVCEGWYTAMTPLRIAHLKVLQFACEAEDLRGHILANLARQSEPELADIRIARGPEDFDPMMMPFIAPFLGHMWRGGEDGSRL